jgi:hypothetical protein
MAMTAKTKFANKLAQRATNKKMLRQPSFRLAAMTGGNLRRTVSRTRDFPTLPFHPLSSILPDSFSTAGAQRAFWETMNNIGHLPLSEKTRGAGRTKARRGRPRKIQENGVREPAAVGTLTRTKSLLLAALRVWELKHRITD